MVILQDFVFLDALSFGIVRPLRLTLAYHALPHAGES